LPAKDEYATYLKQLIGSFAGKPRSNGSLAAVHHIQ